MNYIRAASKHPLGCDGTGKEPSDGPREPNLKRSKNSTCEELPEKERGRAETWESLLSAFKNNQHYQLEETANVNHVVLTGEKKGGTTTSVLATRSI